MSERTTWAVLTDGRYIRVLVNFSSNNNLLTLKANDSTDLKELCYQVVTGVPAGSKNGTQSRTKSNMILLAEFLDKQYKDDLFHYLIVVSPPESLSKLKKELSESVNQTIITTIENDLLANSIDEIEQILNPYLSKVA